MLLVKNKRCSVDRLKREYPDCVIVDVTSKGEGEWRKLSPFYPHGDIPVPFSEGVFSMSVEGIWQGLKVFESTGVDRESFRNGSMKNIKRTCRKYGKCLGHRKGVWGTELLPYIDARKQIYVPAYFWMLDNKCKFLVLELKRLASQRTVILLDYDTNGDIEDSRKPLSHASLICRFIENS